MKIVISGYVGKKITGIGRNLICTLEKINYNDKVVIYCNYDMTDEFRFSNENIKVKSYSISKYSSLKNLLWTTFVFPFKVIKEKGNVALIPNFTLLLFKFKPTVVIMHDLIEFNIKDKFSKLKMFYRTKIADPITAKAANKIITVSENSKCDIIKFLKVKDEKIKVIYNGVDRTKFRRIDEKLSSEVLHKYKLPSDFIMYAGTIDYPGKNSVSVINAFIKLKKEKNINEKLVLVGMPGKGYDHVLSLINNCKFKNDIILTGYVDDEILIALYNSCKVFCFLSLYEGFGIPPLEALACGAPVIVSNTSSLPEVVGQAGIKVDPLDINSISENIYKILKNDKYKYKYVDIIDNQVKKFNWEDTACKTHDVLKDVLEGVKN